MQDAESVPPEAPAQLGGEGRKDVRDLKSGGKERGGTEGKAGGGTQQWRLRLSWQGAGEEEWGREGEGRGEGRGRETDVVLPPSFRRTAPPRGPALAHTPSLICPGPAITVALFRDR